MSGSGLQPPRVPDLVRRFIDRAAGAAGTQRRVRSWAGTLGLLVGVSLGTVVHVRDQPEMSWSAGERKALQLKAGEALDVLLSYSPETIEADADDPATTATGAFASSYEALFRDQIKPQVSSRGARSSAEVVANAVLQEGEAEAELLAYVRRETSFGGGDRVLDLSALVVSLKKVDAGWRISGLRPAGVQEGADGPAVGREGDRP